MHCDGVGNSFVPGPEGVLSGSHQLVSLRADHRIAFAGAILEAVTVEDSDMAARISDQSCLLQGVGLNRNGVSANAEHVRKKLLGQGEGGASDRVLGLPVLPQ
jgi:hypothetical protein